MTFGILHGALSSITSKPCPSGLGHTVMVKVVKNIYGSKFCCHSDCLRANMDEIDPRGDRMPSMQETI
jgi:hypothetical protein